MISRQPKSFNATPKPFPGFQNSTPAAPVVPKSVKPPSPVQKSDVPTFQPSAAAFTPKPVAAPTAKPVSVNVATYDPAAPPAQVSRAPVRSPQPPAQKYHDLNNPQKEGVLRLPTVNFPKPQVQDAKSSALGNISSFMNKQTKPAGSAPSAIGRPEFIAPLVDKEFPLGEPAVLEVRVGGAQPLTVQWYHNNQPVRESIERDIRLLQKGNVYTLVYGEFTSRELGRYTVHASNQRGTNTCSCTLVEGGYDDEDMYPTATVHGGPPMPSRPAYNQTVQHRSDGLPASTKVVTKKPINQLVTSGNAGLYSQNKIEEGLHSALGIQHENDEAANNRSYVLDALENSSVPAKSTSRTMNRLAEQLGDM